MATDGAYEGIVSGKSYKLNDFLRILGFRWRHVARLREAGLVIRDAVGQPVILGSDWNEFVRNCPPHVPRRRGPGRPPKSKTTKEGS